MNKNKKIAVFGLWHQGIVAATCLAEAGYNVVGLDLNKDVLDTLVKGELQVEEPYLLEMVQKQRELKRLKFSEAIESSIIESDYIFISYDTPVSEADISDLSIIFKTANLIGKSIRKNTTLIITSQIPAGTTNEIVEIINKNSKKKINNFAYIPENLKLGQAITRFKNPELPVIGVSRDDVFLDLKTLMSSFSKKWEKTDILTAEMLKHALNTFLSMSVVLANELSDISEKIGANGQDLGRLLKLESRIGQGALTRPGLAFAGGTLARDVVSLLNIAQKKNIETKLLKGIWESNNNRKSYLFNKVVQLLSGVKNKNILILGLTYKVNTNTLRRSASMELINKLNDQGANIFAYDPSLTKKQITNLPNSINFNKDIYKVSNKTDCIIVMTPWDEFKDIDFSKIKKQVIFDTPIMFNHFHFKETELDYSTIGVKIRSDEK